MANKKLINCDQLQAAVEKVKEYVDTNDATKSNSSHVHGNITNGGGLSNKGVVVITDSNGLITGSSITSTELNSLDNIASNVQTQLDGKAGTGHVHGNIGNSGTLATANAVVVTDGNKQILASTSITTTELGYLDGVTSGIQNQLNGKATSGHIHGNLTNAGALPTASTVVITDENKKVTNSTVTSTELSYLTGATSNIQDQINSKSISSHGHGNISNGGALSGKSAVVITDANGLITTSSSVNTTELGYLDGVTSGIQNQLNGKSASTHVHGNLTNTGQLATASAVVVTDANKNVIASTSITTTELGYLDGVTSNIQTQLGNKSNSNHGHGDIGNGGTLPTASTVVIADANKKITNSAITTTELDSLSGIVSNIQGQLDGKSGSGHTHGNIGNGGALSGKSMAVITDANGLITTSSTISTTELGYLDGVTSNVQNQINGKASSGHGHGNITNGGLLGTASTVVVTDADKKITNSTITATELSYLSGATSNIQTQINSKAASGHGHGNITNAGQLGTASAVVITDTNKNITTSSTITTTELGYLDGVTSNVQNQLNGKAASGHTHGNISNTGTLATASMVVITDANKNITTSSTITTTELGYLDGVTSNVQNQISGKAPTSHASTGTGYGVSNATNYGHAMASSTTPLVAGTAAVGTETAKFARGDHVHPAQTSVTGSSGSCTGNASTASKWQTARTLSWTGDASGSMSVDGSKNVEGTLTLAASGVTAGSYGPSANASPAHAGTFSVPYLTVDAKGRVTAASTKTITLPGDNDYRVKNELATTTKAYITGTTSATTATGTQVFDTDVYLSTTAGTLVAKTFSGALSGNATTATTLANSRNFYISDNDATNTGPATSFNGGANATIKLPATIKATLTGNASTATKLAATKTINGTAFDGSQNITTANWGTTRSITIGNKAKDVNGSAAVSWSLSEMGAFPSAGGTATGDIIISKAGARFKATNGTNTIWFGINASGDKWGIYDDTNAKYIVDANGSSATFNGNATTASKLSTQRTITLSGHVTGSAKFDGSGDITIATTVNDITTITKSLTVTTAWMDTGISGGNIKTGTYAVQLYVNGGGQGGQYQEHYSGIMSWFEGDTNSGDADEIVLHKAGHATNGESIFLRTIRTTNNGKLKLQIACSKAFTAAVSLQFKFKKLI